MTTRTTSGTSHASRDTTPPDALDLREVTFAYRPGTAPVLRNVSLRVASGEMVGLIGPNGAGKSTLLRLASGVAKPLAGTVRIQGQAVGALPRQEVARRIAVVPQDFSVQFAYTVRQIVELGRMPHTGAWGTLTQADRIATEQALATTNTSQLAESAFHELSGGERQRVLLALALAQDTSILLLDEPTAHLDLKHQIETLELLRRLHMERGLTILAILHDLNLAARYFDRLVLLNRAIIADGTPAHVLDAALLSRVYETRVQVGILRGEEHLSVLPPGQGALVTAERISDQAPGASGPRPVTHILAGGGSGEILMRTLADARLPFTAGPLNVGDTDHSLAQRLAQECIAEPPYAPISPQALAAARERIAAASSVIVCPMPLGPGNIALIEMALAAARDGADVMLLEPALGLRPAAIGEDQAAVAGTEPGATNRPQLDTGDVLAAVRQRDFTGQAVALYEALTAEGARWVASAGTVAHLLLSR